MRTKVWPSVIWISLLTTLVGSCKKTDDPVTLTPTTTLSLVGTWKITALTFTPAWIKVTNATPIPDFIPYLKTTKGETCLTDMTITFTAAGALTSTFKDTPSCPYAVESKVYVDYLFSEGSTFTETSTQAVLYSKNKATSQLVDKSGTNQLITIQFPLDEDPSTNKIKTTYAFTMARQ